MGVLSDALLLKALKSGSLKIEPAPTAEDMTTSAIDLRLGDEFKRWRPPGTGVEVIIDPSRDGFSIKGLAEHLEAAPTDADGSIVVRPNQFVLGITSQRIELPVQSKLAARVEGRSSLARLGIGVHVTAPTIHAGFRGQVTLEITNQGTLPVRLRPGLAICQLIVEQVHGSPTGDMSGAFQDQSTVIGKQSGRSVVATKKAPPRKKRSGNKKKPK